LGGTLQRLAAEGILRFNTGMSATEIIEQFKALPPEERAVVTKFVVENDDSWIPEEFKEGMADAAAGRFVDMETVLSGAPPPPPQAE
jgi:predicted transcriptional regulator